MKTITSNNNKSLWKFSSILFFVAALMPEYVAPTLTIVCFFVTLSAIIKSKQKMFIGVTGFSVIALYIWMIVGTLYSKSTISALASLGLWLLMFMGYFTLVNTIDTQEKIERTMYLGGISSGIAGFIGIVQMFILHFGNQYIEGISKYSNPFWKMLDINFVKIIKFLPDFIVSNLAAQKFSTFEMRACSTFSNPLFYATFEVTMLPFAVRSFLCGKSRKERIVGLFCTVFSLGGIACSYSRGPYLVVIAVLFILLFYGKKQALKLLGIGTVSFIGIFVVASGTIKRILTLMNGNELSVSTRKEVWTASLDMLKKKPIFGYGTGFNSVRQILHNVYNVDQPHAHNILLEVWLENGILGFLLLSAIFVIFLINIIKIIRKGNEQRIFAVTLLASVSGFFLCGMTDCLFYGLKPLQYFMMILALSQCVFNLYSSKK